MNKSKRKKLKPICPSCGKDMASGERMYWVFGEKFKELDFTKIDYNPKGKLCVCRGCYVGA